MADTDIEWTDKTWNPVRGCSLVSEGCRHCYAMKQAHRFSGPGGTYEGLTELGPNGPRWTGKVRLVPEALEQPLRWKKPQRVFVNSMSDLFHEDVPFEFIAAAFGVMSAAMEHTFQILTKRPRRMLEWFDWVNQRGGIGPYIRAIRIDGDRTIPNYFSGSIRTETIYGKRVRSADDSWIKVFGAAACHMGTSPLHNVWLGVSVENQETADERIPLLLQTPAAVRFVSYEPALEAVDFRGRLGREFVIPMQAWSGDGPERRGARQIDWVIVGGESGPKARTFDMAWARSVVAQCKAVNIPVFVKQMGASVIESHWPKQERMFSNFGRVTTHKLKDRKGGDPAEWPADLRVRQFPK